MILFLYNNKGVVEFFNSRYFIFRDKTGVTLSVFPTIALMDCSVFSFSIILSLKLESILFLMFMEVSRDIKHSRSLSVSFLALPVFI